MGEYITDVPRSDQDRKDTIRTFTGRYVKPLKLRARDICIEDVAHHLSNICRYTGACPSFYSVAQHCVHVSELCESFGPALALAGLLHDGSEAYFNDLASPVKHDPRLKAYRDLEHEASKLIVCVFGLDPRLLDEVKFADVEMFEREAATWWGGKSYITPWYPTYAEQMFLSRFDRLRKVIQ